jgi:hypothetical protein
MTSSHLVEIERHRLCGVAVGYVWYRAMGWQFQRKRT